MSGLNATVPDANGALQRGLKGLRDISFAGSAAAPLLQAKAVGDGVGPALELHGPVLADGLGTTSNGGLASVFLTDLEKLKCPVGLEVFWRLSGSWKLVLVSQRWTRAS